MSNKHTKALISLRKHHLKSLVGFIILSAGLIAGLYLVQHRQLFRSRAAGTGVDLSISPNTVSVNSNGTFTVSVVANPNGSNVSVGNVIVNYPSNILSLVSVTAGPFFMGKYDAATTAMLNKINTATPGTVSIMLGAPCSKQTPWICYPSATANNFALLNFKALALGGTGQISFSNQSQFESIGNTANILGTTTGVGVTVIGPTPTPTPKPSPTATPIPTPTPSLKTLPTISSIVGWADRASCDSPDTAGWATDNRNHAQKVSVKLEVFPNGDPGNKIVRGGVIADQYRADLIPVGVCPDGRCAYGGLKIGSLPLLFLNKQLQENVYGYASDGQNLLLGSKLIGPCNNLIPNAPTVVSTQIYGWVDGANCSVMGGWVTDQRNLANKVKVRADAYPVGEPANTFTIITTANQYRADLIPVGVCPDGKCAYNAAWGSFPASFSGKKINLVVWGFGTDGAVNPIQFGAAPKTIGPCN